jgi:hypothetical protein
MKRENLWKVGLLIIVFGIIFLSLFILSSEEIYFFRLLNQSAIGFLILGLLSLIVGFLFTMICLELWETSEKKSDNIFRTRVVIITVTIMFLILICYLIFVGQRIDYEWSVRGLIIEDLGNQMFGFYAPFTLTPFSILFPTLLIFGILILPFIFSELRILNEYSNIEEEDSKKERQTIKEKEDKMDISGFINKQIFSFKKIIKKDILPIGISLIIIGFCFIGVPPFLIFDSEEVPDPKTGELYREDYKGFIRGQFLIFGIFLLIVGFILIRYFIRYRQQSRKIQLET